VQELCRVTQPFDDRRSGPTVERAHSVPGEAAAEIAQRNHQSADLGNLEVQQDQPGMLHGPAPRHDVQRPSHSEQFPGQQKI